MARRKPTPETSRISRTTTVAYARKQKPASSEEASDGADEASDDAAAATSDHAAAGAANAAATDAIVEAKAELASSEPAEVPAAEVRAQAETAAMPTVAEVGAPPAIPAEPAPKRTRAASTAGEPAAEDPTVMPEPPDVPPGEPSDRCAPPGLVPAGDSRSLRKRAESYEFALVYRSGTFIVTRTGEVGTRGVWRVVEYPTAAAASRAYANESSRFVSEGFSDYRD